MLINTTSSELYEDVKQAALRCPSTRRSIVSAFYAEYEGKILKKLEKMKKDPALERGVMGELDVARRLLGSSYVDSLIYEPVIAGKTPDFLATTRFGDIIIEVATLDNNQNMKSIDAIEEEYRAEMETIASRLSLHLYIKNSSDELDLLDRLASDKRYILEGLRNIVSKYEAVQQSDDDITESIDGYEHYFDVGVTFPRSPQGMLTFGFGLKPMLGERDALRVKGAILKKIKYKFDKPYVVVFKDYGDTMGREEFYRSLKTIASAVNEGNNEFIRTNQYSDVKEFREYADKVSAIVYLAKYLNTQRENNLVWVNGDYGLCQGMIDTLVDAFSSMKNYERIIDASKSLMGRE